MGRFKSKEALLEDMRVQRKKLDALLAEIPAERRLEEVVDGMSVKDFLAHRAEWGRMMLSWREAVKAGESPAVPHRDYKWNQLKALNADIFRKYENAPLAEIETDFNQVHDRLFALARRIPENELFSPFIGAVDLASYINSATAAHYRSAHKHIRKWWNVQGAQC